MKVENTIDRTHQRIKSFSGMVLVAVIAAFSTAAITVGNLNLGRQISFGSPIDEFWVVIAAALVFLMQGGFLAYEVGLARPQHGLAVSVKNLVDWAIGSAGFLAVGFALMFGSSLGGYFGTDFFLLVGAGTQQNSVNGLTFAMFQLAFAGTAITLVSGSLVERMSLLAYSFVALGVALVVYPIYGHWVWGNLFVADNAAWLADLGFHDFAGGTVVHLLGSVVAMVGVIFVGPRLGRFDPDGRPRSLPHANVPMAMLGVLILWFGWWGFNGGSFLVFDGRVVQAILVTNSCAIASIISAGLGCYFFQNSYALPMKLVGGAIGGLVAITPGADVVTPIGSVALGLIAGLVSIFGSDLLLRLRIDDALGVIPAHGFCGIVGTLGVAVFSADDAFETSRLEQLGIQAVGVLACILWATVVSLILFGAIQAVIGLRISPQEESDGLKMGGDEWPYGNGKPKDRSSTPEIPSLEQQLPGSPQPASPEARPGSRSPHRPPPQTMTPLPVVSPPDKGPGPKL